MNKSFVLVKKYLKKVFPEKPIIAFCKMKSIRNYIAGTDINEADDQKRPKITTLCYSCRKKYHLISSDGPLKNIHNGKEIKKLDGGNCRTANIVYAARCKIHGDIYICNTGEEVRERFNKHRYDAKNTPDNNEELWEDKFICLLGTKASTGLNIELKHYGRELYKAFADITA